MGGIEEDCCSQRLFFFFSYDGDSHCPFSQPRAFLSLSAPTATLTSRLIFCHVECEEQGEKRLASCCPIRRREKTSSEFLQALGRKIESPQVDNFFALAADHSLSILLDFFLFSLTEGSQGVMPPLLDLQCSTRLKSSRSHGPLSFRIERTSNAASSSLRQIAQLAAAVVKPRLFSCSSSSRSSCTPSALRAVPLSAASGPADPEAIRLVASDVDGTLLCPRQTLLPRVAAAVRACELEARVPLLLATGKAPGAPWLDRLLRPFSEGGLGSEPRAGVFMQGLFVADASGRVLYSRSLDAAVVEAVGELVEANAGRLTLTAYCTPASSSSSSDASGVRTRVLSSGPPGDERAERLVFYGEPRPEPVTPLPGAASGATNLSAEAQRLGLAVHKLILMYDADAEENEGLDEQLRASILALLGGDLTVSLTSALPGMTEVLPPGASKMDGLLRYLGEVDLPPDAVLAVGDAENDVEMLLLAGIGACVENAAPSAARAADVVVPSNAEGGVADAIGKFVLSPRGLRVPS